MAKITSTWLSSLGTRIVIASLLATVALGTRAQIAGTGNIQGTVSDPSGAVLPNAVVTATETATDVKHSVNTDAKGLYTFPNINIGTYDLTVTAPGFKSYRQPGIVLDVGSSIGVNVTMAVGAADQQVEVEATGVALQTEDATYKQTID